MRVEMFKLKDYYINRGRYSYFFTFKDNNRIYYVFTHFKKHFNVGKFEDDENYREKYEEYEEFSEVDYLLLKEIFFKKILQLFGENGHTQSTTALEHMSKIEEFINGELRNL